MIKAVTTDESAAGPLHADRVSERFIKRIPRDFARRHLIISQRNGQPTECLAIADSTDESAVFNAAVHMGVGEYDTLIVGGEAIAAMIDEVYGRLNTLSPVSGEAIPSADVDALLVDADRDLLSTQGKSHVVKLVDAVLFEALSRSASDVHVQPLADRTLVRYRLDGVLHTVREIDVRANGTAQAREDSASSPTSGGASLTSGGGLTRAIVSRIKVMGRMDIAERRVPQDGRAAVTIGDSSVGRAVDLRISTLPTSYGERAVIRLLDNSRQLSDFRGLGMPADVQEPFAACASRANGIILVTGPTGSGKTTTLYSTLRHIGSPAINIMTIEDPIEYELSTVGTAISQAQVNLRKGVTFATGLRHILRQDPDVIMVGEIRDAETARIAIQSSLTGHLVFSTLHTNDAAGAVTRLIDLGVEPYLLSASLTAVLAQRLVRLSHQTCAGKGCEDCFETGYAGRTAIFELLVINESIRELVSQSATAAAIRSAALTGGMRTLACEGARLIKEGLTSQVEVDRVVQELS